MNDERRQQPTVNLQELERQLREAARARQRAQASAEALSGSAQDRQVSQPIPNPPSQAQASAYQPSLPLTPPAQPAAPLPQTSPTSVYRAAQPQPAAPQSFAPSSYQNPNYQAPNYQAPNYQAPNYQSPNYQGSGYQTQNQDPRLRGSQAASATPASQFDDISDDYEDDTSVLKTDRMGDVYPAYDQGRSRVVEDQQFFSAAAYEEPAANAYDRYTEDQFPKIDPEPRSGGVVRIAVWLILIAIIGTGGYFAYPLVQSVFLPSEKAGVVPPVIKADPKPVKVAPEVQPQDQAGVQKDILSKHANENPAAAQIAAQPEQPVDVGSAAKAGAQATANAKPPSAPLVPGTGEPRLVKTVTVRADGTIIPEKSDPELAAKAMPKGAPAIAAPQAVAPADSSQAPAPAADSGAGLPPLPAEPAGVSSEFTLEGGIPLPPDRMTVTAPDFSLPEVPAIDPAADAAAATPAPTAPGKNFGVQFGAPETEAKGNELKASVERQFASALTGGSVGVFRGESNGRIVYRVRAVGYSRDEANAVCQRVTAAGGQCFVSPNS